MFAPDDTIVAVATAAGRAGIGVVRISGDQATGVARALLEKGGDLQPLAPLPPQPSRRASDGPKPRRQRGCAAGGVPRPVHRGASHGVLRAVGCCHSVAAASVISSTTS